MEAAEDGWNFSYLSAFKVVLLYSYRGTTSHHEDGVEVRDSKSHTKVSKSQFKK